MYKNIVFDFGGVMVDFDPHKYLIDLFGNRGLEEEVYDLTFGSREWRLLDADTARIGSLLLLGRPRLFGLLGRDETLTIPWADIERIGLDAILVRTDIPAPPPSHGGLLDKLHQWLNG